MGNVISTSNFDASKLLLFNKNFERILQQTDSKLMPTQAIKYMGIEGITHISRIDGDELDDSTNVRNPEKNPVDMKNDNRRSVAYRFTKTYRVDSYDKAVNLITDPTGDLLQNLSEAKNRTCDRLIAQAATADVIVGAPDTAGTTRTAEEDGVKTITLSGAFNYENAISPALTMFENNYVDNNGIVLAISANEKEDLRNDDKYMNAFYSSANTVDKGDLTNASGFKVISFAGNTQGSSTIVNPVLKEEDGKRTCLLLAPKSIAFAAEIGRLDVERANGCINSFDIVIDCWFKLVRTQGAKVIKVVSII